MKLYLIPDGEQIVFKAYCKKCGKDILVFDNNLDGYEQCDRNNKEKENILKEFECERCRRNNYSIAIRYEYPDFQDLREDGIINIDNAFSWIWISLKCNNCGVVYRNLIDFEI